MTAYFRAVVPVYDLVRELGRENVLARAQATAERALLDDPASDLGVQRTGEWIVCWGWASICARDVGMFWEDRPDDRGDEVVPAVLFTLDESAVSLAVRP